MMLKAEKLNGRENINPRNQVRLSSHGICIYNILLRMARIQKGVRKMTNRKATWPDHVHGFGLKEMTELHPRL